MSMLDKFRDELYGAEGDEEEVDMDAVGADLGNLLDSQGYPVEAPKNLLICLAIEIAVIVAIIVGPGLVSNIIFDPSGLIIGVGVPFSLGFMTAFTAYCLVKATFYQPSGGSYGSDRQMAIWFISVAGGVLNIAALWILLLVMSGRITLF